MKAIWGIVGVLVLVGAMLAFTYGFKGAPEPQEAPVLEEATYIGFLECLPHKPGVPPTKECMQGLAIDQSDGHVALDFSAASFPAGEYNNGDKVRVSGPFTSAHVLTEAQWQKYDIDGVLRVVGISRVPQDARGVSVEEYVRQNISSLSPQSAVLGGTFYVTNIEVRDGMGFVEYEDGHINLIADFTYTTEPEHGMITITSFVVRK